MSGLACVSITISKSHVGCPGVNSLGVTTMRTPAHRWSEPRKRKQPMCLRNAEKTTLSAIALKTTMESSLFNMRAPDQCLSTRVNLAANIG